RFGEGLIYTLKTFKTSSKIFKATDFITKPVDKDQIFGILNKHLHTIYSNKYSQDLTFFC
ncbi:MAG: hypothetical protein WCO29_21375, partial [Nostocales cyanobacterium ELA583]